MKVIYYRTLFAIRSNFKLSYSFFKKITQTKTLLKCGGNVGCKLPIKVSNNFTLPKPHFNHFHRNRIEQKRKQLLHQ